MPRASFPLSELRARNSSSPHDSVVLPPLSSLGPCHRSPPPPGAPTSPRDAGLPPPQLPSPHRPPKLLPGLREVPEPPPLQLPPSRTTLVPSPLGVPAAREEENALLTQHSAPRKDGAAAYLSPRCLRLLAATASRSSLPTAAQQPAFPLADSTL
ncbi:hypothetical protein VULLAG_LOCUS12823 [Vulpes lagopus]